MNYYRQMQHSSSPTTRRFLQTLLTTPTGHKAWCVSFGEPGSCTPSCEQEPEFKLFRNVLHNLLATTASEGMASEVIRHLNGGNLKEASEVATDVAKHNSDARWSHAASDLRVLLSLSFCRCGKPATHQGPTRVSSWTGQGEPLCASCVEVKR